MGPHGKESQRILNELSAARLCLLNLSKRAVYDAELRSRTIAGLPATNSLPDAEPGAVEFSFSQIERSTTEEKLAAPPRRISKRTANRRNLWFWGAVGLSALLLLGIEMVFTQPATEAQKDAAKSVTAAKPEPPRRVSAKNRRTASDQQPVKRASANNTSK